MNAMFSPAEVAKMFDAPIELLDIASCTFGAFDKMMDRFAVAFFVSEIIHAQPERYAYRITQCFTG